MSEERSERKKQLDARKARAAEMQQKRQHVRVVPKNEAIRKAIKHPSGVGFPPQGAGRWPLDTFTKRRLRDGDITVEEEKEDHPRRHRGTAA